MSAPCGPGRPLDNAEGPGAPRAGACVAVAYSGGRDSTALLHASLVAAARLEGAQVVALHIHHGLSAQADAWLAHAQQQCAQWRAQGWPVSLRWRRLSLPEGRGESVEALARAARYAALAALAAEAGADTVLLAHHRRDQAETVLLQALRGAGVAGLAAMPPVAQRHGLRWVRPWLHQPRQSIEDYVAQHALRFVEDDSNADPRFARNRMRMTVWPALLGAFEQAEASLSRAAARAADARFCLDEWLEQALAPLYIDDAQARGPGEVNAQALLQAPLPRQRELLRHWFKQQTGRFMPANTVDRMVHELPKLIDSGRSVQWRAGAFEVGLYRGRLSWHALAAAPPAEIELSLCAPGAYPLAAWGGTLWVSATQGEGVALSVLLHVAVGPRREGEDFQLGPGRPARAMRKQFQSEAVPAWEREGPVVRAGGRILFVRGLGMDARALGSGGEPRVTLSWRPAPRAPAADQGSR